MQEMTKDEMIKVVTDNISRLKDKEFNVFFFILDTKGNPSSALEYIYQTAYVLKNMGYKVSMLHQEKDFVGVGDWLGQEYANIPHFNIESENIEITPSDFLFIPEIFANVMVQTKKLPCKRVIIVQNIKNICEFMPASQTPMTLGIMDAVVTTKYQSEKMNEYFNGVKCHIVHPSIKKMFRDNEMPRKLIVNIISKDQTKINQIAKPFYWKNPLYKWVSFRDLRGLDQETFSNALRESAITVWVDDDTSFGYTLMESLRCGNVVLAKIPNNPSEWMLNEDGELTESILWFDNIDDLHQILASIVRSWTLDVIPDDVYENQQKFSDMFSEESQEEEIKKVYVEGFFEKRLKDFEEVLVDIENNVFKTKQEQ